MKTNWVCFLRCTISVLASISLAGIAVAGEKSKTIYQNNFDTLTGEKLPSDFKVVTGAFALKAVDHGKVLELPGAPLDSFGVLFGPENTGPYSVAAKFFGTKQGRKFPVFGLSVGGLAGYRLQVNPAKKLLELFKGDEMKDSIPYEWESGAWTQLRLQCRKGAGGGWSIEGKAWPAAKAEPDPWMIHTDTPAELVPGRPALWGAPYAGTPIQFDDLLVESAR